MRIHAQITRTATGWLVALCSPDDTAWQPAARVLESSLNAEFPLPPADEIASWRPDLAALLVPAGGDAVKLRALSRSCLAGDPAKGDAALLGGFLHAVLFGPHGPAIEAFPGGLEIALAIAPEDTFAAQPWELMHAPTGPEAKLLPLAAHPQRHFAILRFVAGLERPTQPLELPLRVLFAIGRQLDSALRPGAEYLGLLRRLGIATAGPAGNARINLRLLTETTTDELEDAIQSFQPHVVHFICHGEIGLHKEAHLLLTEREDGVRTGLKTKGTAAVKADVLLALFAPANAAGQPQPLPCIVVLNACHTADAAKGAAAGVSLAGQLLAGGVPIVIGMAGEVADGACRLFTRGFYEALLERRNLPLAAAAARRSAMLHYKNYEQNVEWARLTFFAKNWDATQAVPSAEAVAGAPLNTAAPLAAAAMKYVPKHGKLLCGRIEAIRAYETFRNGLAAGRRQSVLTFGVTTKLEEPEDQFSKTMLLETIAVQAVLDGFAPCCVSVAGTKETSSNILHFALDVAELLDVVRRYFQVPISTISAFAPDGAFAVAVYICNDKLPSPETPPFHVAFWIGSLREKVRALLPESGALKAHVIRAAMRADFARFRADFVLALGRPQEPLLMIDNLHYGSGFVELLLKELIDQDGFLGMEGGPSIPLIFTYSQFDGNNAENDVTREISEFLNAKRELIVSVELRPINDAEELRLAYSQYLLARKPPLAPSTARAHRDSVANFFDTVFRRIKGVPSRFCHGKLDSLLDFCAEENLLVEANDEDIVKKFR